MDGELVKRLVFCGECKIRIGQLGPRTAEKARIKGTKLGRGRFSMMVAILLGSIGEAGITGADALSWDSEQPLLFAAGKRPRAYESKARRTTTKQREIATVRVFHVLSSAVANLALSQTSPSEVYL